MGRKEERARRCGEPFLAGGFGRVTGASSPRAVRVWQPVPDEPLVLDGLPVLDELPVLDGLGAQGVPLVEGVLPARGGQPVQDELLVPAVPQEQDEPPERDATVPVADGFGWAADASRLVEDGSPEFGDGLPGPVRCAAAALFLGGSVAGSAPDAAAGRQDVHPPDASGWMQRAADAARWGHLGGLVGWLVRAAV